MTQQLEALNHGQNATISSLELSEMSGKPHYNLMKQIRKLEETWTELGQEKFYLSSYLTSQNKTQPMYQLTKTECLYIASKFNDTTRAKLVLRWEQLEQEQQAQQVVKIYHNAPKIDYYTVTAWENLTGARLTQKMRKEMGKRASKICRQEGYPIDYISDAKWGKVNTYPEHVLNRLIVRPIPKINL